ncbi:MAG: DUF2911 domain-containing protein [Cyclobacteriaceae bacterium]|nr:DUF2911 domain-containing protein [Cyclobacteriaceae bacterium]
MKKVLIIVGVIVGILVVSGGLFKMSTKSHSPEDTITYKKDSTIIEMVYCRPFKNGRVIFGELAPYGKVWRTGANEATIFSTSTDLKISNQLLPAGTYSMWTIPDETQWEILFNTEHGQWGVSPVTGEANRDPSKDQLSITVPSYTGGKEIEQFTIALEQMENQIEMVLMWDKTTVVVPISL